MTNLHFHALCAPEQLCDLSLALTAWFENDVLPWPGLIYQSTACAGDRWMTADSGNRCGWRLPDHQVAYDRGWWFGYYPLPGYGFVWKSASGTLLHAYPITEDGELVGYRLVCQPHADLTSCSYMRRAEDLGIEWSRLDATNPLAH